MPKNLIIASTSTIYGSGYLEYLFPVLEELFSDVQEVCFIPYARPSGITHDAYTSIAEKALQQLGKKVIGLHKHSNARQAILEAEAIFTGGGNTFTLVNQLYKQDVMASLREVLYNGTPYLGTSAGSNICGLTMQTSNDMPIIYPPSFKSLGLLPFNINPHYLDPKEGDTHMGETRETRIKEFHEHNNIPVVGLREGSWLEVHSSIILRGSLDARIFEKNKTPYELQTGTVLDF